MRVVDVTAAAAAAACVFIFLLFGSFVRTQSDEDIDGSIVDAENLQEEMQSGEFSPNSEIKCGEFEEYSRCNANPLCQRTCDTFANSESVLGILCPRSKSCIEGCVCKDDYVRLAFYGDCIDYKLCPKIPYYPQFPSDWFNQSIIN